MEKRLNKFGLSSPTRLELMIVLLLALFIPFYSLGHSAGVLGESTTNRETTSTALAKQGKIDSFAVSNNCGKESFRNSTYSCGGQTYKEGGNSSCKTISLWFQYARKKCLPTPTLTPTPSKPPKPSKTPTPTQPSKTPTPTLEPTWTPTPTFTPTLTPTPTPH